MYTIDYFIEKFQDIPEDEWSDETLLNSYDQRCAQGHCMRKIEITAMLKSFYILNTNDYICKLRSFNSELEALNNIFGEDEDGLIIAKINNGYHNKYQQSTPKQRVLAALYDLKQNCK